MTAPTATMALATTRVLWVIAAAVLTVGIYLAWLGWSDETSNGQVLGLAATLSVMVAIVTYRLADLGPATSAVAVVASTLAVTFWVDYATDSSEDGIVSIVWAVAVAIYIGGSAAFGLTAVALLVWSLHRADWTPTVTAVLTVASYLGWLGWDQRRTPEGTGPYEAWQVVGLALTLATVTAIISWRSTDFTQPLTAAGVVTAVLTVAWSIDAAGDTIPDANLWPAGAILLFGGTALGLFVVSLIAWPLSQWAHRHSKSSSTYAQHPGGDEAQA
jgi:hypothetical protein